MRAGFHNGKTIGTFQAFQEQKEKFDSMYAIDKFKTPVLKYSLTFLRNRRYVGLLSNQGL